jgi:hypothetical protein
MHTHDTTPRAGVTEDPAAAWARYRADAPGVHVVGIKLTFDDVFTLCLLWAAAQLLLAAIVGAVAGLVWLMLT